MDNMLIAIILAIVVAGILFPAFRHDIKKTRDTFPGTKPESDFSRILNILKDKIKK